MTEERNPVEECFDAHMEKLREVAREAAKDGFTVVIMGCGEDPMRDENDCTHAFSDYAVYGESYAGIGLIESIRKRIERTEATWDKSEE